MRLEGAALVVAPVLTFGTTYLAAQSQGVGHQSGCNSASNFLSSLFFQPTEPSTCGSVPFLSDIPMIILSFTCPFAVLGYLSLRRRLAVLNRELMATGLFRRGWDQVDEFDAGFARMLRSIELAAPTRVILFALSAALTTWLYLQNLREGHLFDTLASATSTADELRVNWWANYHSHPMLAVLCVAVGTLGVNYALRSSWLYIRVGIWLYGTRGYDLGRLPLAYVPRWRDKSYGWGPVTGVLMLVYASTIGFCLSMVAIFDMLRNETPTLLIALFFAVLGVVSNVAIITTSFFRMLQGHKLVEDRLRQEVERMDHDLDPARLGRYVLAAIDLTSWRRVPVDSFRISILKIGTGLGTLVQIFRALSI